MDNSEPKLPEPGSETEPEPESQGEAKQSVGAELSSYVNDRIKKGYERVKLFFNRTKESYNRTPKIQKVVYQRKFFPAFWTVASIFSLMINIILIALLVSVGHNLFELKAIIADGLVTPAVNNLALMDKAHIVTTVPVETTVRLQDSLPVNFDLPINQDMQLLMSEDTRISGAYIYLNNTPVATDLTLPALTPIQTNFSLTVPVSTSVPVDITVPVTLQVPVDIAIDQTDLHQSIVGLQAAIKPYEVVMGTSFNSPKDLGICNYWLTGWLCDIIFGK
jgi:hypothetical protein